MTLDLAKDMETRDGIYTAEVLFDLRRRQIPLLNPRDEIIFLFTQKSDGSKFVSTRRADGKITSDQDDGIDVVNTPDTHVWYVHWVRGDDRTVRACVLQDNKGTGYHSLLGTIVKVERVDYTESF